MLSSWRIGYTKIRLFVAKGLLLTDGPIDCVLVLTGERDDGVVKRRERSLMMLLPLN